METPLLQTKFSIPQPQPNYVARPDLIRLLNDGAGRKLTLVSAPAGFGKTTLLSEWARQADRPISWVTLEEDDDDLTRFLSYLVVALQKIDQQIGAELLPALQGSTTLQTDTLLTLFVNEMIKIKNDISLILDDYQVIKSQDIHEALIFIIDHSPPNFHLIVAGRVDPFFPISRYRARGVLVELRMEDLRFTPAEAELYLSQMGLKELSEDDLLALISRTEGWISGIHLAALSMQGHESPSRFISEFAGDDRYILDYLMDEVLSQRPIGTRDFLLKTSILERMTAKLCGAVTGEANARAVMDSLEQANLFLIPMDNRRLWYRYHQLFADLLRRQLQEIISQDEIGKLHRLASQWYEDNGFLFEPIHHSLAAEDYVSAIRLIESGVDEIFASGQLTALTKLWDSFSQEMLLHHPKVCMIFGWAWLATGYLNEANQCLRIVEQSFGVAVRDLAGDAVDFNLTKEASGALVEVAVVQSQLAFHSGDLSAALELSQLALRILQEVDIVPLYTPPLESLTVANFTLGVTHKNYGQFDEAEMRLGEALQLAKQVGNIHIVSVASAHLAKIYRLYGDLPRAWSICEQGIHDLQEMIGRSPMSSILLSEWGLLAYEQNNVQLALDRFQEAINLAKLWGLWEALIPSYVGLTQIHLSKGDKQRAFQVLEELETLGKDIPELISPVVKANRAKLWLSAGRLDDALLWARSSELDVNDEISYPEESRYLILIRILIATRQFSEADSLIKRLKILADASNLDGRSVELLILEALSLQAQKNVGAALAALSRALKLAVPHGYVRVFIDEGTPMRELLRKAVADENEPEYAARLLEALEIKEATVTDKAAASIINQESIPLSESLSEREEEVLRYLTTELSGPEIAEELSISLSTLRTHTQNIYGKLGVGSRRSAVRRAEELKLV